MRGQCCRLGPRGPDNGLVERASCVLPPFICVQETRMIRRFSLIAKHFSPPRSTPNSWRRQAVFWGSMFVVAMLTLSACADDSSNRRFANEPPPTVNPQLVTPTIAPTFQPETAVAGPTILSPEALIVSRGAASTFYIQSGPSVMA